MKAVRFYGAEDVRIEDVEAPDAPPKGWIQLKVAWAGICGSDLHLFADGPSFPSTPDEDRAQPITGAHLPITLGHEFSGTITEVGEGVDDFSVGDNVAVKADVITAEPGSIDPNLTNLTDQRWGLGLSGNGGGLSEYVNLPAENAFAVGDMPLDQAAMIEPLSVSTHGVRLANAHEGQVAVVGGAGPIGIFTAAILKAKGVKVIVSEPNDARRKAVEEAGIAELTVDPINEDLIDAVSKATNEEMADLAFDCAGVIPVTHDLIKTLRPAGHLQIVAIPGKPLDLNVHEEMHNTEITYRGTMGYVAEDYRDAIKQVNEAGLDLSPFISARIQPEEIVDKGFKALADKDNTSVKILVELSGEIH